MVSAEIQKTIREMREQKGWDTAHLAKQVCLSVRQVQQLEGEPGDSFYSDHIRFLAAKKVLFSLGWESDKIAQLAAAGEH